MKSIQLLFVLHVCFVSFSQKQSSLTVIRSNSEIIKWADGFLTNATKFDYFNGVVLIARDGIPFYKKGFGLANREFDIQNTPSTKFLIGSVSKQFTAAAILLLQKYGKLRIEEPICKYIDSCPPSWSAITIRHLLNHTSGLINFTSLKEASGNFLRIPHTHEEVLKLFWSKPLHSNPGEKFNYNNSGYYLLGMVVEKITGQPFAQYVKEHLFMPLGMANTDFDYQYVVVSRSVCFSFFKLLCFLTKNSTSIERRLRSTRKFIGC